MAKKSALGRGLAGLLNDPDKASEASKVASSQLFEIPLDQIETNPYQPRTQFKRADLKELAQSMEQLGIVQPVTVRQIGAKAFQLVSGERRLRAAGMAGLARIPAFIKMANDREMLEMALVENVQRRDLNAIEVAHCYQRLTRELKITQEAISKRIGKKRATITNYLRLLRLDPIIQSGIRDEMISMGHGRALVNIADTESQLSIYEQIVKENLNVRQTERLVHRWHKPQKAVKRTKELPPQLKSAQQNIRGFLNAPTTIQCDERGKGKIVINFESENDFQRLYQKLHP